jgi:hypothetical protein
MTDRTNKRTEQARTELSAERLELIRRFMGEEPGRPTAVPAPPPASDEVAPEGVRVPVARGNGSRRRPPVALRALPAEAAPAAVVPVARPRRRTRPEGPSVLQALVGSMRGHAEVGWLVAAVVVGVLVALAIASQG